MHTASRARAFAYVATAYVAALAAAWLVVRWLGPSASPLAAVAWADLAATLVVFAFSVVANNTSVYDPYWSVATIPIALFFAAQGSAATFARQAIVGAIVIVWAVRLTFNWVRTFPGLHHEDWRYVGFREKTGRGYWVVSFLLLHFFPTVQVYLGCLPLSIALTSARPLGPLDALAALVGASAITIETVADEQLRAFRARSEPGTIMAEGLWAYSRHPNYFGEVLFWWALALFALAVDPGAWWTGIGAVAITAMMAFGSVPMIDKRSVARRPAYADHMKRVSALVPWFPKH